VAFLYAEILVLLLVPFLGGCAVAAAAVRLLLRRTAADVSSYVAEPEGSR
jgi:hypothetical protein